MTDKDLIINLAKDVEKPYWWDTCAAINNCVVCPYGISEIGEYYRCGVEEK